MGHHSSASPIFSCVDSEWAVVIFLRSPVERAQSFFRYLRAKKFGKLAELAKRVSYSEFLHSPAGAEIRDGMVKRLGGNGPQSDCSYADLERAMNYLERVDFVGIQEDFSRSVLALGHVFQLTNIYHWPVNSSHSYETFCLTEQERADTIATNRLDQVLYDHALSIYRRQPSVISFSKSMVEEFEYKQARLMAQLQSARDS
jgi:hypothetical protein